MLGWSRTFLKEKVAEWDRCMAAEETGLDCSPTTDSLYQLFEGITLDTRTIAEAIEKQNIGLGNY